VAKLAEQVAQKLDFDLVARREVAVASLGRGGKIFLAVIE
jgi:hypothetical protein